VVHFMPLLKTTYPQRPIYTEIPEAKMGTTNKITMDYERTFS